jgi:hypothetical protein
MHPCISPQAHEEAKEQTSAVKAMLRVGVVRQLGSSPRELKPSFHTKSVVPETLGVNRQYTEFLSKAKACMKRLSLQVKLSKGLGHRLRDPYDL